MLYGGCAPRRSWPTSLRWRSTLWGEELATGESNPNRAVFQVGVEGTPQEFHPISRDEIYRIAGEAMRNAFKHAQARQIEVNIQYDERQFRLRDDGKGIDEKFVNGDGRLGHYGLSGCASAPSFWAAN
jgi:signal transduction histidine kinase